MQLHREQERLRGLNAVVLLLTFSSRVQAQRWQAETSVDFPMLLDAERNVYPAYGLQSSLLRAWQPKVWLRYAQMMFRGWQWRGIQADSGQLGGDFVVDAQGIVRFAHASHDPTDRPALHDIMAALEQLTQNS